jgi:poly(A) polymerase
VQHKIYTPEHHSFPHDLVDSDALFVMETLREAGFTAYLVGGGVRDLLLGVQPKDFDISTSAKPEEVKKLFRNSLLIGRRFRLAHIRFGKKILEVSTFRSGDPESDSLIVRDNVWGSPEEDAMRRDFTINGLFYDPSTRSIIDYVGGFPDAQKKYLRTIGQPYLRFKQDPVRMIRLLKFQARFGFEVDPETRMALLEARSEILKSSATRILEELLRMLESGHAVSFFKKMTDEGLLQLLMPELAGFLETDDGDEIYSFLKEADNVTRDPSQAPLDRSTLLACFVFPLLQRRIDSHYEDRGHHPHIGDIQSETHHLLDDAFLPFFHIPRRLRGMISSILSAQYRITPLEKKAGRKIRIPNDPDFHHALRFFELRCALEPGLQSTLNEWRAVFQPSDIPQEDAPRKRRRRRRR